MDAAAPVAALEPATSVPAESAAVASGLAETAAVESTAHPSAAELAVTAVAAALTIPVNAALPAPVAASAEPIVVIAGTTAPPLSRRARRTTQTAEQPVIPPIASESPAPAEQKTSDVMAIAAAPASSATLPDAVLTPAEPFVLLEPVVETAPETVDTASVPFELIEPADEALLESASAEPTDEARFTASDIDEFEAAARLFSFTGETPIQTRAEPIVDETVATETVAAARPARLQTRLSNGAAFRRVAAASFSVGVMGIVGLLTVGMTTPAEAVAASSAFDIPVTVVAPGDTDGELVTDESEIQAYVAPASVEDEGIDRGGSYASVSMAQIASESGIQHFSNFFVNDPNSPIQWPFAVGVPISYGFGMRSGAMHQGVDFTPGAGSPIQAIADGVVRVASDSGGAYGVHVIIDHMIDGQLVSSHYAHMQYGSLQVSPGQQVTVGTILGRTGNTGRSFGAHTHFEILMDGTTPIDPIPWMRAHAGG